MAWALNSTGDENGNASIDATSDGTLQRVVQASNLKKTASPSKVFFYKFRGFFSTGFDGDAVVGVQELDAAEASLVITTVTIPNASLSLNAWADYEGTVTTANAGVAFVLPVIGIAANATAGSAKIGEFISGPTEEGATVGGVLGESITDSNDNVVEDLDALNDRNPIEQNLFIDPVASLANGLTYAEVWTDVDSSTVWTIDATGGPDGGPVLALGSAVGDTKNEQKVKLPVANGQRIYFAFQMERPHTNAFSGTLEVGLTGYESDKATLTGLDSSLVITSAEIASGVGTSNTYISYSGSFVVTDTDIIFGAPFLKYNHTSGIYTVANFHNLQMSSSPYDPLTSSEFGDRMSRHGTLKELAPNPDLAILRNDKTHLGWTYPVGSYGITLGDNNNMRIATSGSARIFSKAFQLGPELVGKTIEVMVRFRRTAGASAVGFDAYWHKAVTTDFWGNLIDTEEAPLFIVDDVTNPYVAGDRVVLDDAEYKFEDSATNDMTSSNFQESYCRFVFDESLDAGAWVSIGIEFQMSASHEVEVDAITYGPVSSEAAGGIGGLVVDPTLIKGWQKGRSENGVFTGYGDAKAYWHERSFVPGVGTEDVGYWNSTAVEIRLDLADQITQLDFIEVPKTDSNLDNTFAYELRGHDAASYDGDIVVGLHLYNESFVYQTSVNVTIDNADLDTSIKVHTGTLVEGASHDIFYARPYVSAASGTTGRFFVEFFNVWYVPPYVPTLPLDKPDNGELTIATGQITVTGSAVYQVDTESNASTDDLTTINGGTTGMEIILEAASTFRDVVIKHNTGNIVLSDDTDFTMDNQMLCIGLVFRFNHWVEMYRYNGAVAS